MGGIGVFLDVMPKRSSGIPGLLLFFVVADLNLELLFGQLPHMALVVGGFDGFCVEANHQIDVEQASAVDGDIECADVLVNGQL